MDERTLKALVVLFLALAIGAVFGSVQATSRASAIQGPSALLVTQVGEVWLGVDRELWRISADGKLRDAQPVAAAGLPGAPASLVHGPGGSIVASVRGDTTLYQLNPATARVTGTTRPQWPADLERHGGRAIHLAIDADGRVAVATGGGDAVALFDAQGRFLARTRPGAYEFTNGLWWSQEGLWTTDTNRFTLRLLDPQTLLERQAVNLGQGVEGRYLGPARARSGVVAAPAPMAALVRYREGMTEGGVVLVDAQARTRPLPYGAVMQPRDLDWQGDDLLVSDGASFSILRWSAQGRSMAPFGDSALRERLGALVEERDALRAQHVRWLMAAVTCLLLGLACAAVVPWLVRRRHPAPPLDLSRLGTPQLDHATLLKQRSAGAWIVMVPVAMLALVYVPAGWFKEWFGELGPLVRLGMPAVGVVLTLAAMPLIARRQKRLAFLPDHETLLNQLALNLLKRQADTVARLLREREHVLETFHLRPGLSWWVMTNQRLLHFKPGLFGHRLSLAHELGHVVAVSNLPGRAAPKGRWKRALDDTPWLEVAFEGGTHLSGAVGSQVLAKRVVAQVSTLSTALRAGRTRPSAAAVAVPMPDPARRWRRALASSLLPGLGQWQQRRTTEAAVLLVLWAMTMLFFSGPALWTFVEPYTALGPWHTRFLPLWHVFLSLWAATDAWRGD